MAKSNPRLTDSKGPKDGRSDMTQSKAGASNYTSSENQKGRPFSGVADTAGAATPHLKRSTPGVGVYQSEGQNRGGPATSNRDSSTDAKLNYCPPSLDALRAKRDAAKPRGSTN